MSGAKQVASDSSLITDIFIYTGDIHIYLYKHFFCSHNKLSGSLVIF